MRTAGQLVFLFLLNACEAENITRVELVLIRHSVSCSNMLKWHGENQYWSGKEIEYPDPLLSDIGLADAHALSAQALQLIPDFVGSSRLMRSMETAHALFPGRDVHVWPHVDEMDRKVLPSSVDPDDLPLPAEVQDKILAERYGTSDWVTRRPWKDAELLGLQRFLSEVVPTLPVRPRLRLVVVTHSNFMQWDPLLQFPGRFSFLGAILPWARSVQGFLTVFEMDGSRVSLTGVPKILWPGFDHKLNPMSNCSDVGRCDPYYMAHVRDESGNVCGHNSQETAGATIML